MMMLCKMKMKRCDELCLARMRRHEYVVLKSKDARMIVLMMVQMMMPMLLVSDEGERPCNASRTVA